MVSISNLFLQYFALQSGWYWSWTTKFIWKQIQKFYILSLNQRGQIRKMLLLQFGLCLFGGCSCTVFHCSLWLLTFMLCLYVCIQSRIRKILLTTTTNKISPLNIFARPSACLSCFKFLLILLFLIESFDFFLLGDNFLFNVLRWRIHIKK